MTPNGLNEALLQEFIVRKFGIEPGQIGPDVPIFSSGLLDSFHLLDLLSFIEAQAAIRVKPGEISLDNLDTVRRILSYAARKSEAP